MNYNFEAVAEVGDRIRCWDFERRTEFADRFVEGEVIQKGFIPVRFDGIGDPYGGFYGYEILVDYDSVNWGENEPDRVDMNVYVPFKTSIDFEYRIEKA